MNNKIHACADDFELYCGEDSDEETGDCIDIYQEFIINEMGATWLREHTNEIVYYSSTLDVFIWGITHWGTSWDYVHTLAKGVRLHDA